MIDTDPLVYSYDRRTGEYIGAAPAARNPVSKTEPWMLPAAATWDAPPKTGHGIVAVFRNGVWGIEQDHRKETWWNPKDGRPSEITELGNPADSGFINKEPPKVAIGEAAVWGLNDWTVLPDHRGAIWYDAEGNKVTVREIGVPTGLTPEPPDLRTDDEKLASAKARAYSVMRGAMNGSPYSAAEAMGFAAKEAEARDVPNGFNAPSLIVAELNAEGIKATPEAVAERAAKIIGNADAARERSVRLAGLRRKYEAMIASATTVDEADTALRVATEAIAAL